jgi:HD-GYP domain-containing protein (c-di-GMP phosphodiesterase class II)
MNTLPPNSDPGTEMAVRLRYACEAHDPTIGSHLDRVSRYAAEIGRLTGLSPTRLAELHYATPLHDVGKIGVPIELLNKPAGLTTAEMDVIKQHTVIGFRMLDGSAWPVIRCAALIALAHHECWDGGGYPHGVSGGRIPLEARIVAVADVYDALISRRAYKPAWEEDRVMAEMRQMRAVKFDPEIFDLFVEHLPGIVAASEMALQTGTP